MTERQLVNPYWLERRWNRVKHRFANIHGGEERYATALTAIERQAAFCSVRHPEMTGSQITQAYRVVGLHVAMELDPSLLYVFEGFDALTMELVERCLATFHPDIHPEMTALAAQVWQDAADRVRHFTMFGAIFRRLVNSADVWTRDGPRAYIQFVLAFLEQLGWDPNDDSIDAVVVTGSPPS